MVDTSSPTHAGRLASQSSTATWSGALAYDAIFGLFTSGNVDGYASASLTDAAATTNRLTGGTGSFVAGKVSEDGLVDDLGWTANDYTEVLYSITLKQSALTDGDTLDFRVLRNAVTTEMVYTVVPSMRSAAVAPMRRRPLPLEFTVTFPAATVQAGWTVNPAVKAVVASYPAVTAGAAATVTPAPQTSSVTFPAVTAKSGWTASPAASVATVSLPVVQAKTGWTVSPAVHPVTASFPAATAKSGWTVTPAAY